MKNNKQNKLNFLKIRQFKKNKKNKLNNWRNWILKRGFKKKKYLILWEFKQAMSIILIKTKEKKENRILNIQVEI